MDKPELTEENLKQVFMEEYIRAVEGNTDCEDGFRQLTPERIRVSIQENRVSVQFPSLHMGTFAASYARQAAEAVVKRLFGTDFAHNDDFTCVLGDWTGAWNGTSGMFRWDHNLVSESTTQP